VGYNFYGFTSSEFEDLVQALFQKLLGNSSIVYGLGADGARELTYTGAANFGSPLETQDGLWIVQAKFKSRDIGEKDQYSWVKTQFINEMRKFESGKYPLPNQYIFVTNSVLTPALEYGGRDRMQAILDSKKEVIPNIYIVAYDELCKLILNNADVRLAFNHLLHPGDQLFEIKEILSQNGLKHNLVVAEREVRPMPTKQSNTTSLPGPLLLNIDFGTSFSLGSVFNSRGDVELIPSVSGEPLLHSTVSFFSNGCYSIGSQTLTQVNSEEIITISNVKRELGTGKSYNVYGRRFSAEAVASLIVKSLKVSAEEFFGFDFKDAVVSKPSNYNIRQTKALHSVFEQAGLKVARILDEGTSPSFLFPAVIVDHPYFKDTVTFLVMDLGGGTLDLSIQEYEDGVLETKAVLGDNLLGGIDYDRAVLELVSKKFRSQYPHLSHIDFNSYLTEAERVKKMLTMADSCSFVIADYSMGDGNLIDLSVTISRSEFREYTSKLNTRIMQYLIKIGQTAKELSLNKTLPRIDAIMLTGQGAKIFTVKEIVANLFPGVPTIDKYMENAVCLGNAHQAGVMAGTYKQGLLLNVHNTSLAFFGAQRHITNSANKLAIPVVFRPEFNTVLYYLIEASTVIPCKNKCLLELKIDNAECLYILPIYEISNSSTDREMIAEVKIPVASGVNLIEILLDIDVASKISIEVKNEVVNHFATHSVI
jgi:molecular chaperone DnaK (HSP70)